MDYGTLACIGYVNMSIMTRSENLNKRNTEKETETEIETYTHTKRERKRISYYVSPFVSYNHGSIILCFFSIFMCVCV